MIINKCPDLKRKYKIKTHLVCKFIQDASKARSPRRCGMAGVFPTWILKGKSKNNSIVCVSAHYSTLIPSNAVWSLEAGTLISCIFCSTNSSWRAAGRTSLLEAEIRGGQNTAGEAGRERRIGRHFLTCLQRREKILASPGRALAAVSSGEPGLASIQLVQGPGWEWFQGRKSEDSLNFGNINQFQMEMPPPRTADCRAI